ncbi:MAG: DUF2306 domain-containing protein [Gaiellales bacterium]
MSAGLALLGLIPGLAGLLVELAESSQPNPADERSASLVPVVVHVVSGTLFAVLGAFQFPTALRPGHRTWHRRTGRLLAPLGLTAAVSGLWLTLFYPHLHESGALLTAVRLTFGTAMAASIIVGFTAIRRRDVTRHLRWMIRAYALALGIGTQIFTIGFGEAVFGTGDVSHALLAGAGWAINLAVAEWVIRSRLNRRAPRGHMLPRQSAYQPN